MPIRLDTEEEWDEAPPGLSAAGVFQVPAMFWGPQVLAASCREFALPSVPPSAVAPVRICGCWRVLGTPFGEPGFVQCGIGPFWISSRQGSVHSSASMASPTLASFAGPSLATCLVTLAGDREALHHWAVGVESLRLDHVSSAIGASCLLGGVVSLATPCAALGFLLASFPLGLCRYLSYAQPFSGLALPNNYIGGSGVVTALGRQYTSCASPDVPRWISRVQVLSRLMGSTVPNN